MNKINCLTKLIQKHRSLGHTMEPQSAGGGRWVSGKRSTKESVCTYAYHMGTGNRAVGTLVKEQPHAIRGQWEERGDISNIFNNKVKNN